MKNKLIFAPIFAVTFLLVAGLRADELTWYTDKDIYADAVGTSNWMFGDFRQVSGDKSPREWAFTMFNDGVHSTGMLTMSDYNGAGGLMDEPQGGHGTIMFAHNSANEYSISFGTANFVNSFFMDIAPWSSWSAAITFAVTADYWLDGVKYTTDAMVIDMDHAFFGVALGDGAYLAGIHLWSTGTPNNGYKVEAGSGSDPDPSSVPEPATLALVGLGVAGLGLVVRTRRRK